MILPIPPLILPDGLAEAVQTLPDKDCRRLTQALEGLHAVNSRLWEAEDRVRAADASPVAVADAKRAIDQLNAERNQLAERADEVLATLATTASAETPVHTETIAGSLDRLSVLTLRVFHTERAAVLDDLIARRVPTLHQQRDELGAAIDILTIEVMSGRRRLPNAARHKLYGRDEAVSVTMRPARGIDKVVAFGGLSECGKSTSARYLVDFHGAQRLKIGYLLQQGALRRGLSDPYQLSAARQAELLLEELNRFAEGHRDVRLFTIESVHDDASIAELKELMGDVLQIVYLDVPFDVRATRSGTCPQAVAAKDEVKLSRGAHRVLEVADFVLDNTGSVLDLRAWLAHIAQRPAVQPDQSPTAIPQPPDVPTTVADATAALADTLRSAGPAVQLAALTGSPVQGAWIPGWSDLDLLVVADHQAAPAVSRALADYRRRLGDVASVGLTLVTADELLAHRLVPRLAFALYNIQNGMPVLHRTATLHVPVITPDDLARAAVRELPQVVITLRRLRAEATPGILRQLYKHIVLAARLILRENGQWTSGPDQILAAASNLPGLGPLDLPTLQSVADAWREGTPDNALSTVIAAADRLLAWYALQLAA
ncbi:DUF4254 domain-containing protein [Kitasatospora acidiphila]|uniref:DUF4254 domain-containing protein n=1 Tax=Kitasatospora acidiphila TaxID=2567942 RepID=A0A540VYV8_9ACTN|nr:DUF4254 domain-containing protein [Kitasatospora acidiphila]TQF01940.1 DUF4254 domain-containing protein [Kitasatospora acidiphila]